MRSFPEPAAFAAAVVVTLLLAAAAALGLAFLLATPLAAAVLGSLPAHTWWFSANVPQGGGGTGPLWSLGAAIAASCLAVPAAFRARALVRKSSSPMPPFVLLFLFSIGFECLRAGVAVLVATDRSISTAIILTRAVYWARLVGLFSLLACSLYSLDMQFRNRLVLAGGICLLSFAIAAYIPIDRTLFLAQLTGKLGDEQGVWFVSIVVGALVLASLAGSALQKRDLRLLALVGGFALLLAARELLFFALRPAFLALGLALLAAGAAVSLRWLSRISAEVVEKRIRKKRV